MSTIAAQQKQDFFDDLSNRADIEEFTTSSILDFLNKERQCNFGATDDAATDIDVESIFEEINRLSDNTDRSVEEILREAELLITNQQSLIGSNGNDDKKYIGIGSICSNKKQATEKNKDNNKKNDFHKIVDIVQPDSVISDESTPQYMGNFSKTDNNEDDNDTTDTIEEIVEGIDTIQVTVNNESDDNINWNKINNKNNNDNKSIDNNILQSPGKTYLIATSEHDQNNKKSINSPIKGLLHENVVELSKSKSLPNPVSKEISENLMKLNRKLNDKTSSSPQISHSHSKLARKAETTQIAPELNSTSIFNSSIQIKKPVNPLPIMVSVETSPIESICISREYSLKQEIDQLQEKLKDTEERLQSLRIQHDSLSQIHRDLRENQTHVQEESELLKLDVQHLTDCANILRTELKSARNDRNEALDVQKQLQSELEDNKLDKKKMQEQSEKDTKIIQDLQRQCKEMERILMRKHPDSVSALIVASKNPSNRHDDNSVSRRLLEQRIAQLESDAKDQDKKAQKILANVQARFNSVQSKYETHIADLETQVLSLQEINTKLNEKIEFQIVSLNNFTQSNNNFQSSSTQTHDIPEREIKSVAIGTQTDMSRPNSATAKQTPNLLLKKTSSKIPSSHSETTISNYHSAAKEDAHLLATIRGMRIDLAIKDKAMQRLTRELDECKKTIKKLQKEKDVMRSEKSSSFASTSSRKNYDPTQYFDQQSVNDNQALKEALNKIKLLEFDYKALHDKRLQDLKTLQAAHERELASCHETVRILQQRLTERDEAFANQKRRKVPIDYYALKAKVTSLERRHSEREQRLHMLVEALSKGRLNGALEEILTDNDN